MDWEAEASPRDVEDIGVTPFCPEIPQAAAERGITSIVHFTRIRGFKGILHSSAVKARRYLSEDERVRHVYEPNAPHRDRDMSWHNYVNLSVTDINRTLFGYSSQRWHRGDDWVILEFDPEVLGHFGVVFCTTNNAYANVHRCEGLAGFNQMFASAVPGYGQTVCTRRNRAPKQTTDPQAELLYPRELSLKHLRTVKVQDENTLETVEGILTYFPTQEPHVVLSPEAFDCR